MSLFHTSTLFVALLGQVPINNEVAWKPARGPLATRWATQVDSRNVHPEYPRPQMLRPEWVSLNGLWDYAIRPRDEGVPSSFDGRILVPFPVESALSGVMKPVKPEQMLWYHRSFELGIPKQGKRWLLHFGAVDWDAAVSLNGRLLGEHRGGYDPFDFDITDALVAGGKQELLIAVWDPTDRGSQPRGKQVLKPGGIMYTANTGIWQTVWLEPVAETHIKRLTITPDVDRGEVRVSADLAGPATARRLWAKARVGDREIGTASATPSSVLTIKIASPKLWSPDRPFLYDLTVGIEGGEEVQSYFGLRKISIGKDASGINRLMLNNQPLFQFGPLDQGWWPDGLYTAPTDAALKYDVEITKRLGFNMIRKHVKVEPDRWYYWCDTMGMLVWQDMPAGDNRDDVSKKQFAVELERMIDALRNHPSIVMWVPFNEGWGQHETPRHVDWIKHHDPTRLVNNASGWTDTGTGDAVDMHNYPGPGMPPTEKNRVAVLGEFGGLGLPVKDHLWVDKNNWGYRSFTTREDLGGAYESLIKRLRGLAVLGLSAAVYTQTTDCEVEVNGLLTYDRDVLKVPESVAEKHKRLYGPLPSVKTLVPSAQTSRSPWSFTSKAPPANWRDPEFDDSAWSKGKNGFGTRATPGSLVSTEWNTPDIWLRREFSLDSASATDLQLLIHHDEDAEVYLNGRQVQQLRGYTTSYALVPLDRTAATALKQGRNVLAVHCHQTGGGQYIDVGLIDLQETSAGAPR
jgi:beta-galactosidase/beta-glucuronidase